MFIRNHLDEYVLQDTYFIGGHQYVRRKSYQT